MCFQFADQAWTWHLLDEPLTSESPLPSTDIGVGLAHPDIIPRPFLRFLLSDSSGGEYVGSAMPHVRLKQHISSCTHRQFHRRPAACDLRQGCDGLRGLGDRGGGGHSQSPQCHRHASPQQTKRSGAARGRDPVSVIRREDARTKQYVWMNGWTSGWIPATDHTASHQSVLKQPSAIVPIAKIWMTP